MVLTLNESKEEEKTSFKNTLSSFRARLLLTICIIRYYQVSIGLVISIYDPTEVAIQKMIEASQRMLKVNSQEDLGRMSRGSTPTRSISSCCTTTVLF
jgi:hypothetical protein